MRRSTEYQLAECLAKIKRYKERIKHKEDSLQVHIFLLDEASKEKKTTDEEFKKLLDASGKYWQNSEGNDSDFLQAWEAAKQYLTTKK